MQNISAESKPENILFFTVHKAASMFVYKVCHDLSKQAELKYYSVNHNRRSRYYFDTEESDLSDLATWGDRRGCFAPLRFYFKIPEEMDAKVILHLRDPRDVLVSLYYSEAYSHSTIKGIFELGQSERAQIIESGIDRYVLNMAAEFNQKYTEYRELFSNSKMVFVKYEDMVLDFPKWINAVMQGFGINDQSYREKIKSKFKNEFNLKKEDIRSHKRKIIPGDYLQKLQKETIAELDSIFRNNLEFYRYDSGHYQ